MNPSVLAIVFMVAIQCPGCASTRNLTADQQYILQFLRGYRTTADELCALSQWPASKLMQVLGHLEVLGIVHADADGYIAAF